MVLPAEVTSLDELKSLILNGVTASDNVDGPVNASLDIDFGDLTPGTYGEKQVVIFATDSSHNRGEATRTIEFAKAYSSNLIAPWVRLLWPPVPRA